jgi:hypothetical protein
MTSTKQLSDTLSNHSPGTFPSKRCSDPVAADMFKIDYTGTGLKKPAATLWLPPLSPSKTKDSEFSVRHTPSPDSPMSGVVLTTPKRTQKSTTSEALVLHQPSRIRRTQAEILLAEWQELPYFEEFKKKREQLYLAGFGSDRSGLRRSKRISAKTCLTIKSS